MSSPTTGTTKKPTTPTSAPATMDEFGTPLAASRLPGRTYLAI